MRTLLLLSLLLPLLLPASVLAGIGLLYPADDVIPPGEPAALGVHVRYYEPLARRFPELAKPRRMGVQVLGETEDLLPALKPGQDKNPVVWTTDYTVRRPGDYTFYAELAPVWDGTDEQFLVHQAKVCVNALGREEGWDEPVGLEAEIVPLSRPYGVTSGSLFSGQVLFKGEPAAYVLVAIVPLGPAPDAPVTSTAPALYPVHKVRTDSNGVFHVAMPRPGWWGFAATLDADWTLRQNGTEQPVALVTSYWVLTREF